jgi:hypothetical protein
VQFAQRDVLGYRHAAPNGRVDPFQFNVLALNREGGHMHEFEIAGENYGIPDPDEWGPPVNSETRKTLIKALYGIKKFSYLYDFGDGWDHRIKVEKKLPAGACPQVPYCIDGANTCPPEDIGGAPGYA